MQINKHGRALSSISAHPLPAYIQDGGYTENEDRSVLWLLLTVCDHWSATDPQRTDSIMAMCFRLF